LGPTLLCSAKNEQSSDLRSSGTGYEVFDDPLEAEATVAASIYEFYSLPWPPEYSTNSVIRMFAPFKMKKASGCQFETFD
jgi:hypothetical protein